MLHIHCLLESFKVWREEKSKDLILETFQLIIPFIHYLEAWPLVSLNILWTVQWGPMGCSVLHRLVFVQFVLVCLASTDRVAWLVTLSLSE